MIYERDLPKILRLLLSNESFYYGPFILGVPWATCSRTFLPFSRECIKIVGRDVKISKEICFEVIVFIDFNHWICL